MMKADPSEPRKDLPVDGWEALAAGFTVILVGLAVIWIGGHFGSVIVQSGGLLIMMYGPLRAAGAYVWSKAKTDRVRWFLSLIGLAGSIVLFLAASRYMDQSLPSETQQMMQAVWVLFALDSFKAVWTLWRPGSGRSKNGAKQAS